MVRILLVSHHYPEHRAGVEIVAGEMARRLAERGFEIIWVASGSRGLGATEALSKVVRVPMRSWNVLERRLGFCYPLWGPFSLARLLSEVRRCDVVHLQECLYAGNVVAFLGAWILGKPVVVTQHASMIPYQSWVMRAALSLANRWFGSLVLAHANRCIFISAKARDYFTAMVRFRRLPEYVPNGVDVQVFRPLTPERRREVRSDLAWPPERTVALFVGRFVELKRLDLMHLLARALPQLLWVFVGSGPLSPAGWKLPNVQCLGSLPQHAISTLYQAADLLVLPSVGEGFPLVVQEAMACGTPVLISHDTAKGAPGVERVAYTAEPTLESMSDAVRQLLNDSRLLESRRDQVARYAREQWDWERCIDYYSATYSELAAQSTAHRNRCAGHAAQTPSRLVK